MMKWRREKQAREDEARRVEIIAGLMRRLMVGNGVFPLEEHRPSWCYITINGENVLHLCASVQLRKTEEDALFGRMQILDDLTFIEEGFGR